MNILSINHYAGGPSFGMEYRPYYLAREWVRAGHAVTVVAASQSHLRSRQPKGSEAYSRETIEGIRFIWCRTPAYRGNGVGRVLNIGTFLLRLMQSSAWLDHTPDVVIASSTYPADIGPARRIARKAGAMLVWEVHDLWPLSPMALGGMSRWHPFILWMQHAENAACRNADAVISILPFADLHLKQHGMSPEKFHHVPNGIDPDEWLEDAATAVPPDHLSTIRAARARGHLIIGYAGSHGAANSLDTMLDAAKLLRGEPVTWLLVGQGPDRESLQQRVTSEQLAHVHLLEPVAKSAVPTLLREMDLLYIGWRRHPLYRFGISPNKLVDYMMAGRPVIHGVEAANDPVRDAGCGISVPPEDPAALARAVQDLLHAGPAARHDMGRSGIEYIRRNHLYPVLARRFLDALGGRCAA